MAGLNYVISGLDIYNIIPILKNTLKIMMELENLCMGRIKTRNIMMN